MGASSYRSSSYSGKGSTTSSRISSVPKVTTESLKEKNSEKKNKSPMLEMLGLLEEVEKCREVVASKEADLESAKKDLENAEQKVSAQINKLDSETKARFRRMMGGMNEKEQGER